MKKIKHQTKLEEPPITEKELLKAYREFYQIAIKSGKLDGFHSMEARGRHRSNLWREYQMERFGRILR